jgi:hypothetical protein
MKQVAAKITIAAIFSSVYSQVAAQQWTWRDNPVSGKVVGLSEDRYTWNQAEAIAITLGGHLVTIRSQSEQDWLFANYNQLWFSANNTTSSGSVIGAMGPWIGLNDVVVEGFFNWSSGEVATYSNWQSGQPNNGVGAVPPVDHDHVAMIVNGQWFDTTQGGGNYDNTPLKALIEVQVRPAQSWSATFRQAIGTGSQFQKGVTGDINADGRLDALCLSGGGAIQLLLNNGQGGFSAPGATPAVSSPGASFFQPQVGDLDGDGDLDLVISDLAGYIHVAMQISHGVFQSNSTIVANLPWARGLEVADLDSDGDLEIIASTGFGGGTDIIVVYSRNRVSGVWSVVQTIGPFPGVTESINSLRSFDMDGDGHTDIAAACGVPGVMLLRGSSSGQLQFLGTLGVGRSNSLNCGDVDRDGDTDIVVAYSELNQIQVLQNLGSGAFAPAAPIACGSIPEEVSVGDFSGDARADIVVACTGANRVDAFMALPNGGFEIRPSFVGVSTPTWASLSDVNNDGKHDMLAISSSGQFIWSLNQFVYDCDGNGIEDELDVSAGAADCNGNLRPDTCDILYGSPDCNVNGVLDVCDLVFGSRDVNGDQVPDECQPVGTVVCAGDGSGANCPCANYGGVGRGCGNAGNSGGAALTAIGSAHVSRDTVLLLTNGTAPSAVGLFIQGTIAANGSIGTPFGDGLRCAAGSVLRLDIATASGGVAQFPKITDPKLSVVGQIPVGGATRIYQLWYRDSPPFCTASTFNLTNGLRVVWTP